MDIHAYVYAFRCKMETDGGVKAGDILANDLYYTPSPSLKNVRHNRPKNRTIIKNKYLPFGDVGMFYLRIQPPRPC